MVISRKALSDDTGIKDGHSNLKRKRSKSGSGRESFLFFDFLSVCDSLLRDRIGFPPYCCHDEDCFTDLYPVQSFDSWCTSSFCALARSRLENEC